LADGLSRRRPDQVETGLFFGDVKTVFDPGFLVCWFFLFFLGGPRMGAARGTLYMADDNWDNGLRDIDFEQELRHTYDGKPAIGRL
jgi:hypothetical protein